VKTLALPPKSTILNAYAERWVRSVKEECLSKVILFGERSLKRALHHYELRYHQEGNHQGNGNLLLFASPPRPMNLKLGKVRCRERFRSANDIKDHPEAAHHWQAVAHSCVDDSGNSVKTIGSFLDDLRPLEPSF